MLLSPRFNDRMLLKGGEIMEFIDYPERFDDLSEDRKQFLLNWIDKNLTSIKSFNIKQTSYRLKQLIQGDYFTNGEFKGAMIKSGYKVKDPNALNWVFNVSEKSPIILETKSKSK